MNDVALQVCHVWKKFRRGEIHTALRDVVPALARAVFRRRAAEADLTGSDFWALQDVAFDVRRGEAVGVIGPNGAGKSTLLKLLTRILKPTRGHCDVRGRVSALIEVAAGFHPDLTGRENVFLQGAIMGMKRLEVARKLDAIVDFAGLQTFVDTPVKRYSSGMHARLGFSIAAHLDPEILLIDEVLAVGDVAFQERCLDRLRQFKRDGVAIAFVSHNLHAVAALCDRAVVLSSGRQVFDGPLAPALDTYMHAARSGSTRYMRDVPAVGVVTADLRMADGQSAHVLAPHTPCELRMTIEALAETPPFNIGIEFERTRDLFYCYGATTLELGYPLFKLRKGQRLDVVYRFRTHFTRGDYRINLNARVPDDDAFLCYSESAASFTVSESMSYDGLVDVELTASVEGKRNRDGSSVSRRY